MPRILTPSTHNEETLKIAYDLLSPGWELAWPRMAGRSSSIC